jgi:hypothetical protein
LQLLAFNLWIRGKTGIPHVKSADYSGIIRRFTITDFCSSITKIEIGVRHSGSTTAPPRIARRRRGATLASGQKRLLR